MDPVVRPIVTFSKALGKTSSRPQRPLDAEFENIKCIKGDLFTLSTTFKF